MVKKDGDSNTTAILESGHYKNDVTFFHNTGEKNDDEENGDEEIDVEETNLNENDDKENDDDDYSSASSEGFKKAVAL